MNIDHEPHPVGISRTPRSKKDDKKGDKVMTKKREEKPEKTREIYTAASPFISTISYSSPALLLSRKPRPLPLPLDSENDSSSPAPLCASPPPEAPADVPLLLLPPPIPPKLMGCSSRQRQAQMPKNVMNAALAPCRPHQSQFAGTECVYKVVAMRWRKCRVRAKSGISLDRATRRRRNIALVVHLLENVPCTVERQARELTQSHSSTTTPSQASIQS